MLFSRSSQENKTCPSVMAAVLGVLALCLCTVPHCLSDTVLTLTGQNFFNRVFAPSDGAAHFIMFYGPWCEHCQSLLPKWQRLGERYQRSPQEVTIAKVDCTQDTPLCAQLNIKAYPTLRLYHEGVSKRYDGKRKVEDFAQFIEETAFKKEGPAKQTTLAESDNGLYTLTSQNFNGHVDIGLHFVEFYAPWCTHCQRLAPTWRSLAEFYKDTPEVTIAKIDCTEHSSKCTQHKVGAFPTLKLFKDGREVDSYDGPRTLEELRDYMQEKITEHNPPSTAPTVETEPPEEPPPSTEPLEDDMIKPSVLNDNNFDTVISIGTTFVEFYAPWCKHCKQLAPVWDKLANKCADQVAGPRIAKVDCTAEGSLCSRYNIEGYPTLLLFRNGERSKDYTGSRDLNSLFNFVMRRHEPEL